MLIDDKVMLLLGAEECAELSDHLRKPTDEESFKFVEAVTKLDHVSRYSALLFDKTGRPYFLKVLRDSLPQDIHDRAKNKVRVLRLT
jgi:hypothetical protein